jgi:hypothetical protein
LISDGKQKLNGAVTYSRWRETARHGKEDPYRCHAPPVPVALASRPQAAFVARVQHMGTQRPLCGEAVRYWATGRTVARADPDEEDPSGDRPTRDPTGERRMASSRQGAWAGCPMVGSRRGARRRRWLVGPGPGPGAASRWVNQAHRSQPGVLSGGAAERVERAVPVGAAGGPALVPCTLF